MKLETFLNKKIKAALHAACFRFQENRGFSLIEVVVGAAIISISFLGLMTLASTSFYLMEQGERYVQASFLLEEGTEALRVLRDSGWQENIGSLNVETSYCLVFSTFNNSWGVASSSAYIDGIFERSFILYDVNRDHSSDDIVDSGGVLDPNTKKVVMSVSWLSRKGTTTKSISTYLMDIFND